MKTQHHSITLAILAGGEGSRMGFPKTQIRVNGEPILSYLARQLLWSGPTMVVTAPGRTQPEGAQFFGREVVDPIAGQGPLRGVLTALENTYTDELIVLTVDMPAITAAQLTFLIDQLEAANTSDAVMLDREGQVEPFPSIYRRRATDIVRAALESNTRAMHALTRHEHVRLVTAPADWPPLVWTNLNAPSDLDVTRDLQGNDHVTR